MANAAITVDLNARIAQFETELKRASGSLDSFARKGDSALSSLKSFGTGLAGALSIGAITAFAKSGIDAADSLNDMSQRLGVSVKDLASFKLAAEQSGTSLDGVGAGIARLTKSVGEAEAGNKGMAKALQALSVTSRDPKEAFFQLADAVQRIEDPSKRAALLSQVLGKNYQELVPLLAQGGDALRESSRQSESFADAMARLAPNADKFNDQLADLKLNAAGAAAGLLNELVPAMNRVFDRFEAIGRLRGAGASLFEIITGKVSADYKKTLDEANAGIAELEAKQKRLGTVRLGEGDQAELARLKAVRAEAQAIAVERINAPPNSASSGKAGTSPTGGIDLSSASKTTGTKSDPLASLLGGTQIGKLAEFDKQVALLNARFDGGRKNTELYAQAITRLVETTFSANFSDFNKQLAEQDETKKLIAAHLQATNDELYAQQQAWVDAGRALEDEMRTPLENANIEFGRLDELLARGAITWETYSRAVLKTQESLDKVPDKLQEMDTFAKTAAENIQNSFSDFLFDPFDKGMDGMLKSFGQTIQRMIANAVAADLAKKLFGGLADNGATSGSGWAGAALNMIGGLLKFDGGGYTGDGARSGGLDGKGGFLAVMHPRETVLDHTRGQGVGSGHTIIVNVSGNSAPDVRNAAGQVGRSVLSALEGARRYG